MTPLLREVGDADLDVLFLHWTDPEANRVAAFTSADPHDRGAFDERWARLRTDPSVVVRAIVVDEAVAGSIGSWDAGGIREVTYWIGREHWGKGLATAALREFLESIETSRPLQAATVADNVASQRVLEKCGFRRAGTGRAFAHGRGAEVEETIFRLDA